MFQSEFSVCCLPNANKEEEINAAICYLSSIVNRKDWRSPFNLWTNKIFEDSVCATTFLFFSILSMRITIWLFRNKVQSCSTKKLHIQKLYVSFVIFSKVSPGNTLEKWKFLSLPLQYRGEHFRYKWWNTLECIMFIVCWRYSTEPDQRSLLSITWENVSKLMKLLKLLPFKSPHLAEVSCVDLKTEMSTAPSEIKLSWWENSWSKW